MKSEVNLLLLRAKEFLKKKGEQNVMVKYFYRNKPPKYYDDIMRDRNGIMEPYKEDYNGDPGSAINGSISGLFFAAKVDRNTGLPPTTSPFGAQRLNIPIDRLMHTHCNMYFTDFYCNYNLHYVTLVVAEIGSEADRFCEKHAINIGLTQPKNEFLFYVAEEDRFYLTMGVGVEVLYTEPIDIARLLQDDNRVFFSWVETRGRGSSTTLGLPKNNECPKCNLYPNEKSREF